MFFHEAWELLFFLKLYRFDTVTRHSAFFNLFSPPSPPLKNSWLPLSGPETNLIAEAGLLYPEKQSRCSKLISAIQSGARILGLGYRGWLRYPEIAVQRTRFFPLAAAVL
jgi:hypothetical protein